MFFVTKYNYKFKLKVVQEYLNNAVSYSYLVDKYRLKSHSQIYSWLNSYRKFGKDGLKSCKNDNTYSVQFKLNAIELYLTSKKTYLETAHALGMNNHSLIANWLKQFKEEGIDGLSRKKGRPSKMSKNKDNNLSKSDKDKIKELEGQLLTLQIENAYLKELRKLRKQEEKQRMKLSRPSSLASEENSN